jgi:hypothetical protein
MYILVCIIYTGIYIRYVLRVKVYIYIYIYIFLVAN